MELAKMFVRLSLDSSQYKRDVANAVAETKRSAAQFGRAFSDAAKVAAKALGVALAGGIALITQRAAALQARMSGVRAVLGATEEEATALKNAVLDLSIDPNLKVSATQAADAMEMLARNGLGAGLAGKQLTDTMEAATRAVTLLSNSTGGDFANAADIMTDAMAVFNIEAKDAVKVVDQITGVTTNSKLNLEGYGFAMAGVAGVAETMGLSIEDMNAALAFSASRFADGSTLGNGFKSFLNQLIPTSDKAKGIMQELGLIVDGQNQFFDKATGSIRPYNEIIQVLNDSMGNLTDEQRAEALKNLFGARGQIFASSLIDRTRDMATEFDNVATGVTRAGQAGDNAKIRIANFSGGLEILRSVLDGISIKLGDVLLPHFETLLNKVTPLIAAIGNGLVPVFAEAIDVFAKFGGNVLRQLGIDFDTISDNAEVWGQNTAVQFANGIAKGIAAILRSINSIANVLAFWLQPNSPPKIAPQIDTWGQLAMQEFVDGMLDADFSILQQVGDIVEDFLRDVAPADDLTLVDRIIGSRSAIAEALANFETTGGDVKQVIADIEAAVGDLPEPIENYTEALLLARDAALKVKEVQEEVNRISNEFGTVIDGMKSDISDFEDQIKDTESAFDGFLEPLIREADRLNDKLRDTKDAFNDALDPLNDQLGNIRNERDDIRSAQRLAEIEAELAATGEDALSTEEQRLRQLERQEIVLRQKIRDEEQRRDTVLDTIQAEIDANADTIKSIEEQRDAQLNALDGELQRKKEILEQTINSRDIALEAAGLLLESAELEKVKADERFAIAQNIVGEHEKQRDLLGEQLALMTRMAEEAEAAKAAAAIGGGGAVGAVGAIGAVGAVDPSEFEHQISTANQKLMELNENWATFSDDPTGIGEKMAKIFEPVTEEFDELLKKFGSGSAFFEEHGEKIELVFKAIGVAIAAAGIVTLILAILTPVGLISAAVAGLYVLWETNFLGIRDNWTEVYNTMKPHFIRLGEDVEMIGRKAKELYIGWSTVWWPAIKKSASEAWEAIKEYWQQLVNWLTVTLPEKIAAFKEAWALNWEETKAALSESWEAIKERWDEMVVYLTETIPEKLTELKDKWVTRWESMKTTVTSFWDSAKSKFNSMIEFFTVGIPNAVIGLRETFDTQFNKMRAIIDPLIVSLNTFIDAINRMISVINQIPAINIPEVPNIPGFATGVTNFAGGIALVGERGPELVTLPRGSNVIPNGETNSILNGVRDNASNIGAAQVVYQIERLELTVPTELAQSGDDFLSFVFNRLEVTPATL